MECVVLGFGEIAELLGAEVKYASNEWNEVFLFVFHTFLKKKQRFVDIFFLKAPDMKSVLALITEVSSLSLSATIQRFVRLFNSSSPICHAISWNRETRYPCASRAVLRSCSA